MLNTWNPAYTLDFDRLNREFDKFFGLSSRGQCAPGSGAGNAYPSVRSHQDEQAIYVEALVPGVNPESIEISVEGDQLTISGDLSEWAGKDKAEEGKDEKPVRFSRSFTLAEEVVSENAKAACKNGILTLTLPKPEKAKPKQIPVKF
jgi:HSP20 family protein